MTDGDGGNRTRRRLALFSGLHLTLAARLKAYLFTGILVTAPISITLYLAWLVVDGVDRMVGTIIPVQYHPDKLLPFTLPGLGLLLLLLFLIAIGMASAGFAGRLLVRLGEAVVGRMPLLRGIHSATKQIFETVLAQKSDAFREVVLVEFPRTGCWSIAFVTGTTKGEVARTLGGDMVNVFVPTTPNPTSGYLLFLPRAEVKPLRMSVEDGLKMVVSGGLVGSEDAAPPPSSAVMHVPRV